MRENKTTVQDVKVHRFGSLINIEPSGSFKSRIWSKQQNVPFEIRQADKR